MGIRLFYCNCDRDLAPHDQSLTADYIRDEISLPPKQGAKQHRGQSCKLVLEEECEAKRYKIARQGEEDSAQLLGCQEGRARGDHGEVITKPSRQKSTLVSRHDKRAPKLTGGGGRSRTRKHLRGSSVWVTHHVWPL